MGSEKIPTPGRELIAGESVPDDFFYCTKEVLIALLANCGSLNDETACEKLAHLLCQKTFLNGGKPLTAEHITVLANELPDLPERKEDDT